MKKNTLSTGIKEYWNFEKAGDSILGKFIGTTEGKLNTVAMLKTSKGVVGINITRTLETIASQLEEGKAYVFTFKGYGKSDKGDYYIFDCWNPDPETDEDKKQLRSWWDDVTFTVEVEQPEPKKETNESESDTEKDDDDLPF